MSLESSIDEFVDVVKTAAKGENILHSNKAINESIFSNFTGAVESIGRMSHGDSLGDALVKTFANGTKKEGGKLVADGGWNIGKIAGSYIGVSAAARIASGGGIYKDRNGNANLIGVPFV